MQQQHTYRAPKSPLDAIDFALVALAFIYSSESPEAATMAYIKANPYKLSMNGMTRLYDEIIAARQTLNYALAA